MVPAARDGENAQRDRIDEWWNPSGSTVRFEKASLGRFEPKTNPTRGKAREKTNRHPNGELLLQNADAVIDALPRKPRFPVAVPVPLSRAKESGPGALAG